MNYIKLKFTVPDIYLDRLIAELDEIGIDQFQQLEGSLVLYLPCDSTLKKQRSSIKKLLELLPEIQIINEEIVEEQNWNATWQQTIKPQTIGPFLVKPSWSDSKAGSNQIPIVIDPQMAFGTGYHETTRLMLQELPKIITTGDDVLDAGTGTGILAIAAVKLDAKCVTAFDHDEKSIINAQTNISLNKANHLISLHHGSQSTVKNRKKFDVILANIHRNIILQMMPWFASHLKKDGCLLLSGLLKKDLDDICNCMKKNRLTLNNITKANKWMAIRGENESIN